jgi:hypothetical protein
MKISLLIIALLITGNLPVRADGIADAKAAYQEYVDDQIGDKPESLDHFMPNCAVTYTLTDGTNSKDITIPMLNYAALLEKGFKDKVGTREKFGDPAFTANGNNSVSVTNTVLLTTTNGRHIQESVAMVYLRDIHGRMYIKQLHVTVPKASLPDPGAASVQK